MLVCLVTVVLGTLAGSPTPPAMVRVGQSPTLPTRLAAADLIIVDGTVRTMDPARPQHMALANGRALALAGVTAASKDPPGGLIVRDPRTGEPTGVLKDAAMVLVERVIPGASFEDRLATARAATAHAARLGVTSVQDMS